jgi:pimeloyl-ACP methyl ester carboxylesterase
MTDVLLRPGARLAYDVTGEGRAVVLVHGFGLDMRMWDPQLPQLAERFRVVRYDCRGFGASGPFDPAVAYTHAGDVIALLDHLGIARAALVGLSFGGRVVLQTALAAPDRVTGVALLGAVLDGVEWDPESAAALDETYRQAQSHGLLGQVTTPTLVAVVERDVPCFREMSPTLARDIPGARFHLEPGAGHMINMEHPAEITRLLLEFLTELPLV